MQVVGVFLVVMGAAIAAVWTRDIISGEELDMRHGRLRARDPGDGSPMLAHWIAEYLTAALLIVSAVAVLGDARSSHEPAMLGLGALIYTSINSLGWVAADRTRLPYGIPMIVGALGGIAAAVVLLTR